MAIHPGVVEDRATNTRDLYVHAKERLLGFIARQVAADLDTPPGWAERKPPAVQALRTASQSVVDEVGRAGTLNVFDAVAEVYNTVLRSPSWARRLVDDITPGRTGRRPPCGSDRHPDDRPARVDSADRRERLPLGGHRGDRNAPAWVPAPAGTHAGRHAQMGRDRADRCWKTRPHGKRRARHRGRPHGPRGGAQSLDEARQAAPTPTHHLANPPPTHPTRHRLRRRPARRKAVRSMTAPDTPLA